MDIYQIWTTYNKPWSRREIAAFSVILIFTITGILLGKKEQRRDARFNICNEFN